MEIKISLSPAQLPKIAAALASTSLLFLIIATATTGWKVWSVTISEGGPHFKIQEHAGLFHKCIDDGGDSFCLSTINTTVADSVRYAPYCSNTLGDLNSRYRASQGFAVLAILTCIGGAAIAILSALGKGQRMIYLGGVVLLGASAFCSMVCFAVFAGTIDTWYGCGFSYCDLLHEEWGRRGGCPTCGHGYSFGLMVFAWFLTIFSAISLGLVSRSVSGKTVDDGGINSGGYHGIPD